MKASVTFASMPHLSGDKISDNHTTVISTAEPLVRFAHKDPQVKKIVLGRIDNTTGTAGGNNSRLKIIDEQAGLLLSVTGSGSHQEVRVYIRKIETYRELVKKRLAQFAREQDFAVSLLNRSA